MKPLNLDQLRASVRASQIEWRRHVLQKLAERGLQRREVLDVLLSGERIRDYGEDRPFPSALFLGYVSDKPIHVVAACDECSGRVFIITAYEPSLDIFEPDYRTKRKL